MCFTQRLGIWPTLPLNVYFRKKAVELPFPLSHDHCRVFSKARHAIWNACRVLGLGNKDVVLVPAYHHGCEIEALLQAGLTIRYYEVTDLIEPDQEKLQSLLTPEVRVLYIIHYLGFPQDALRWRQWCDERGLLLFEDAAQSFLTEINNQPVGSFGHIGVFCLYKTYGIPDGGAVISVTPPLQVEWKAEQGVWPVIKRHVNWLAERWALSGALHLLIKPLIKSWKKKSGNPHKEFELGNPSRPPFKLTTRLFSRISDKATAERRRDNYRFLLNYLCDWVPQPFLSLPEGACPFAFPILAYDADAMLKKLRGYGVDGLLFWRNPHPSLPVADFPVSMSLREKIFAVPVHQELTRQALERIAHAVQKTMRQSAQPVVCTG